MFGYLLFEKDYGGITGFGWLVVLAMVTSIVAFGAAAVLAISMMHGA